MGQTDNLPDLEVPCQEFYPPSSRLFKHRHIGGEEELGPSGKGEPPEGVELQPILQELIKMDLETVITTRNDQCFRFAVRPGQRTPKYPLFPLFHSTFSPFSS
jgi:hypothetical protein